MAFDWFSGVPPVLELAVLVASAVAALFALYKTVYTPIRHHFNRVNAGMDTLLGYPAVKDPGSGREIQAATPPLAARVYDLEETNKQMASALGVLADNQQRILDLEAEWAERKRTGQRIVDDFTAWREQVDAALHNWVEEQDELARLLREHTQKEIEE